LSIINKDELVKIISNIKGIPY